jgi:hypothetical protein
LALAWPASGVPWPGATKRLTKEAEVGAEDEAAMLRHVLAAQAAAHTG